MKIILSSLLFVLTLSAGTLQWTSDYDKAIASARQNNKQVMLLYSAPWCPECNYMKEVVFADPKVNAFMKKHFVLLSLNIQKDTLPKAFPYVGIPTFYIINPVDNKAVGKIEGGSKASVFLEKLEKWKTVFKTLK